MPLPQLGDVDVTKVYRIRSPHGIAQFSIHSFAIFIEHAIFCTVQFHDTIHVAL